MAERFDLVVVGGGPGGYVAALRASQLGLSAAVVEREHLGGVCLNWGCIPTKSLLHAAEVLRTVRGAGALGIEVAEPKVDVARMVAASRKVAGKLSGGVGHLLRKAKVRVFEGEGALAGPGRVAVTAGGATTELEAANVILAPGARPRTVDGLEADGERIWTYKEAMAPGDAPARLLVVGAGAIGIEFASFYRSLGVDVTVVEMLPRVLPQEDAEISDLARKAFERDGIRIVTGARVDGVDRDGAAIGVRIATDAGDTETVEVDRVLVAAGIVANTEGLGLETGAVRLERGRIVVDEWLSTDEPGVFAIGDATGPPWLAHKAMHEGVVCVEKIAGHAGVHPIDRTRIPACTYSIPQVASVGLGEDAAREAGHEIRVGRFPFRANGKALAIGEPDGLVKTVFDRTTGELLGAHLIGAGVTELVPALTLARTLESTEAELMATVFPHPTQSEALHESVLDAFDRALHF